MSKNIKDILKNGEEAYENFAWENFSKKLDQNLPIKKSLWKTKFVVSVAIFSILVLTTTLFLYDNSSKNSDFTQNEINLNEIEKSKHINKSTLNNFKEKNQVTEKENLIQEKNIKEIENPIIIDNYQSTNLLSPKETDINEFVEFKSENVQSKNENNNKEKIEDDSENSLVFPEVNSTYCIGDVIFLQNKNSKPLILEGDNDKYYTIPSHSTKEIKLTKAGNYYFVFERIKNKKAFSISESKSLNINSTNEITYDNGIPYIEISTKDFNENTEWKTSKGLITHQNSSTKLRCFEKGNYEVSLIYKDNNSCVTVEKTKIEITENYNLLAVNAFVPNDHNPKNRTFMPEALKYRQSAFDLIIFDPKDNHLVFKSNSVDQAWEGIDQSNGKMVDENKLFVWKVILKNPEFKEKSEYSGTIVRL